MNLSSDAPKRILVVEDEPHLAEVLCDYLKAAGYETEPVADGIQVIETFPSRHSELDLLDMTLPGTDGVGLCRRRRTITAVPVFMVSARVTEMDGLVGSEA